MTATKEIELQTVDLSPESPTGKSHGEAAASSTGASAQEESGSGGLCQRLNPVPFFRNLNNVFGWHILCVLVVVQWLVKGAMGGGGSGGYVGYGVQYLLAELNVPAESMQTLISASLIPWSIKPLIGMLSDVVPLFGYHKTSYLLGFTALGIVGACVVAFVPYASLTPTLVTIGAILVYLLMSAADLLTEAAYAKRVKANPKHGPALVTFVWAGIQFWQVVAVCSTGYIMQKHGTRSLFVVIIPFIALMLWPVGKGYLGEVRQKFRDGAHGTYKRFVAVHVDWALLRKRKKLFLLGAILALCAIASAVVGICVTGENAQTVQTIVVCVLSLIVIVSFFLLRPPTVAKVNAWFFVHGACALNFESASLYFYTDTADVYPDGPNFTKEFYIMATGLSAAIFGALGVVAYKRWMQTWKYRNILLVANLVYMFAQLLSIPNYTRANVKWGISDEVFVFGSSAIQQVTYMLAWMPGIILVSHLCHGGVEATMYALLAGSMNFGANVSYFLGAFVEHELGITPSGAAGDAAKFDNMWKLALIAAVLPITTLALLPWLIPDARQDEKLDAGDEASDDDDDEEMDTGAEVDGPEAAEAGACDRVQGLPVQGVGARSVPARDAVGLVSWDTVENI